MSMQPMFVYPIHVPGALSANMTFSFEAWGDLTIHKVFAMASNDSSATLKVGITGTAEAYITEFAIGDSNVPVRKETIAAFNGSVALSQFPHVADGTVVLLTLDHDGDSGTSASDLSIFLIGSPG